MSPDQTAGPLRCCAICFHWVQGCPEDASISEEIRDDDIGTCQAAPPKLFVDIYGEYHSIWPRTHCTRVCGEFYEPGGTDGDDPDPGEEKPVATITNITEARRAA